MRHGPPLLRRLRLGGYRAPKDLPPPLLHLGIYESGFAGQF